MGDPVSTIRNLGPAMEDAFAKAGIRDADTLRQLGCDEAYARLLESGHRPHFIAYYALAMGLQGRPWNDLTPDEKVGLRKRFDALTAKAAPSAERSLEMELREIGILPSRND